MACSPCTEPLAGMHASQLQTQAPVAAVAAAPAPVNESKACVVIQLSMTSLCKMGTSTTCLGRKHQPIMPCAMKKKPGAMN